MHTIHLDQRLFLRSLNTFVINKQSHAYVSFIIQIILSSALLRSWIGKKSDYQDYQQHLNGTSQSFLSCPRKQLCTSTHSFISHSSDPKHLQGRSIPSWRGARRIVSTRPGFCTSSKDWLLAKYPSWAARAASVTDWKPSELASIPLDVMYSTLRPDINVIGGLTVAVGIRIWFPRSDSHSSWVWRILIERGGLRDFAW
jgi:hypothetical protein